MWSLGKAARHPKPQCCRCQTGTPIILIPLSLGLERKCVKDRELVCNDIRSAVVVHDIQILVRETLGQDFSQRLQGHGELVPGALISYYWC